jgi:hypothetical protein
MVRLTMRAVDADHEREDRAFPHQVEIPVPERRKLMTMLGWCIGKRYRTRQVSSAGATKLRWYFAESDDATLFQATFGGTGLDAAAASSTEPIRNKRRGSFRPGLLRR